MGILGRLYRGETDIDFVGARKRFYIASAIILVICFASMGFKGFSWGIEFAGGNSFVFSKPAGSSIEQVEELFEEHEVEVATAQEAGRGGETRYVIKTAEINKDTTSELTKAIAARFDMPEKDITANTVSSSWGDQVTKQALIGLAVFLVLVSVYIAIRYERNMAMAAIAALGHDLIITAGVYSLVGFEVTPSTVVGLLTILGFSLYDTVVVFDKVEENTKGLLTSRTQSYGEAANLAVNQTLMRSINTTVISLLPVGGLLFVGAGMLGVGTLKDLALVLFVGLAAGAYSSLFLATPILVDLVERQPKWRALREKVQLKRAEKVADLTGKPDTVEDSSSSGFQESDDELATVGGGRRKGRHGRAPARKRGR